MQALHARRTWLLVAVIALYAAGLWLLGAHIYQHVPGHQTQTYWQLKGRYGELIAPASGLEGMMGVRSTGLWSYLAVALALLVIYFGSMIAFVRFGRDWRDTIFQDGPLPRRMIVSASMMIAFVTVGIIATVLELSGAWSTLHKHSHAVAALLIYPTFYVAAACLAVSWIAWLTLLRRVTPNHDRFIKVIVITYMLFVVAGALTIVAAWFQMYYPPVRDSGIDSGAYTGMGIGFAVMLWTLGPSMVTIYRSEYYRRSRNGLCIACGYDVRGKDGESCPECGCAVSLKHVRKMKGLTADVADGHAD